MRGISDYSFLFSNLNKNNSNNIISNFNFTDLATIKNGSYKKLIQAQYGKDKQAESSTTSNSSKVTKADLQASNSSKLRASVDTLKKSVDALDDKDLWKQTDGSYDMDKITKAVKTFATNYNDVVDKAMESKSSAVKSSAGWMNSLTNTMKDPLQRVGVKLGDDKKLTVDEEALKNADIKSLQAMFSGSYSYANQTAEKAGSVASAALKDTSFYTNTGSYANMMSSWFNTSV